MRRMASIGLVLAASLVASTWGTSGAALAKDFKGPADLCAFPSAKGLTVVVPDLVKSEIRIFQLGQ